MTHTPSAYDHHNRITDLITQADTLYESYNQTTQNTSINDLHIIQQAHKQTTKDIQSIQETINTIQPLDPSDQYTPIAHEHINHMVDLLTTQEAQLLDLRAEVLSYDDAQRTPDTEAQYKTRQQNLIDSINSTITQDNHTFQQAQATFAQQQ